MYVLLLRAIPQLLIQVASDCSPLAAEIGFSSVLHLCTERRRLFGLTKHIADSGRVTRDSKNAVASATQDLCTDCRQTRSYLATLRFKPLKVAQGTQLEVPRYFLTPASQFTVT